MKQNLTREEAIEWIKKLQKALDSKRDYYCLDCDKPMQRVYFPKPPACPLCHIHLGMDWEETDVDGVITFLQFIFDIKDEELK